MANLNLRVTDTLQSKKRDFIPLQKDKVSMYVCGVTPYDYSHIGHGRVYVTFDLLFRLLNFMGYNVTYCRNYTDIDDKLINRAIAEFSDGLQYGKVADKYIAAFNEDMLKLNCLKPTYEPKVTENIPEIIEFISGLIASGKAYAVDGDVYFHVRSFGNYGKLSKRDLDDLKVGARVEINDLKKDPLDFALWKSEPEGQFFKSPWGYGRPGWHIECSALAKKFIGDQLDIHAGGMDLIFPHHENEIAQSEGLSSKQFAQYWMHNAFVRINKEKMSKSLGNFFTLRDVFKEFDPMVIKFYYLNHSYNTPLDFSFDDIKIAQKNYQKLCKVFDGQEWPYAKNVHHGASSIVLEEQRLDGASLFGCGDKSSGARSVCLDKLGTSAHPAVPAIAIGDGRECHSFLTKMNGVSKDNPNNIYRAHDYLLNNQITKKMIDFLLDDLNTPGLFGVLFENLKTIESDKELASAVKYILVNLLGLLMIPLQEKTQEITPEIVALIKQREDARALKDWAKADRLRDELKALGFDVQDKKI